MRDLLVDGLAELERFASARVLLAFDFDGTLAPIQDDPRAVAMRPTTRKLLAETARLYDCAVLSGRSHADVTRLTAGIDMVAVIGNHGLEPWDACEAMKVEVARWRELLAARLDALPGVEVEDKQFSLAVHWRRAADRPGAREAVLAATRDLGPLRLLRGKQVLNLLPESAWNKGRALARLRDDLGSDCAVYVGDDVTDEDVFASTSPALLGIRVGRRSPSAAGWFIHRQRDIDRLLEQLVAIAARRGLPPAHPRLTRAPSP